MKKSKLSKMLSKKRQKLKFGGAGSRSLKFYNSGQIGAAVKASSEELKSNPNNPAALYVSGLIYKRQGQYLLAADFFKHAITYKPDFAEAFFELGNIHHIRGQIQEAVECIRKALEIKESYSRAWEKLGEIFYHLGNYEEIANCYKHLIEINAPDPKLHSNMACAFLNTGHLREAENSCMRALELDKNFAPAFKNLGAIYSALGLPDKSVGFCRESLSLEHDHNIHSSVLFDLNYLPEISQEEIFSESLLWNEQYASLSLIDRKITDAVNEKETRLKIGYLSPDFRDHSVSFFFEPVLHSHDRESFKIYCYSNVKNKDEVTNRIMADADEWFDIRGMEDQKVAELINNHGIDILVDLAGHSLGNRLLVFAHRPAPVQVTWLGYPNTTGLMAMDYRLTDSIADPLGESDDLHSEKLIRLAEGFLCYQPNGAAPETNPPPCIDKGYITFGSFNKLSKVSGDVIKLWVEILNSIDNSRLILKSNVLENVESKERFLKFFGDAGIDANRIELLGWLPDKNDHLSLYNKIDIALDTFPYNGTTTTCEALWMGVPVVTFKGHRHSGRVGASIMHHAGFNDFAAESPEGYKVLAVSLAKNTNRLKKLRSSQRERLQKSALLDGNQFTKILEDAYKEIRLTK